MQLSGMVFISGVVRVVSHKSYEHIIFIISYLHNRTISDSNSKRIRVDRRKERQAGDRIPKIRLNGRKELVFTTTELLKKSESHLAHDILQCTDLVLIVGLNDVKKFHGRALKVFSNFFNRV